MWKLPSKSLTNSVLICSSRRRSVTRFSCKSRATSGVGFIMDSAKCWTFKSTISSTNFTTVSVFINSILSVITTLVMADLAGRHYRVFISSILSVMTLAETVLARSARAASSGRDTDPA